MFKTLSLALVLGALSLAPASAQGSGSAPAARAIGIPIWLPPIPIPPIPRPPPPFPFPFPFPTPFPPPPPPPPQQHVDPGQFSSSVLPYGEFESLGELARALTLEQALDELRASDDPEATLDSLERRLGDGFARELAALRAGFEDGQLEAAIRRLEVEIGARRLLPVPGGGFNPFGIDPSPLRPDPLLVPRLVKRVFGGIF